MKTCDPKGRDCIEKNSLESFNCNTTCVGIYADVQFVQKSMNDELKVEQVQEPLETEFKEKFDEGLNMLLKRLSALENTTHDEDMELKEKYDEGSSILSKRLHDLERKMKLLESGVVQQINKELLKRSVGENGRELDKDKYNVLIAEYMKFKSKHVKHFRFSSTATSTAFGKIFSVYSKPFSVSFIDECKIIY